MLTVTYLNHAPPHCPFISSSPTSTAHEDNTKVADLASSFRAVNVRTGQDACTVRMCAQYVCVQWHEVVICYLAGFKSSSFSMLLNLEPFLSALDMSVLNSSYVIQHLHSISSSCSFSFHSSFNHILQQSFIVLKCAPSTSSVALW